MAQFARPDSTLVATAFTGGHADIDEVVPSNADHAFSSDGSDAVLVVGLSNVQDPLSSAGHVFRYRLAKTDDGLLSGTGNAKTCTVRLMQGDVPIASSAAHALGGSYALFSRTLSAAEADAITDYTDLRLEFTAPGGGGNPSNRRGMSVSWAELEVPDAPVVDARSGSASPVAHGHSASGAGARGARSAAAVSQGHSVAATGLLTGASGSAALDAGHFAAATGRAARGDGFAGAHGSAAQAAGEKSSEEEPPVDERSGSFALGHASQAGAAASTARGAGFASDNGAGAATSGRKQARAGFAQAHGLAAAGAGLSGALGQFAPAHGHSAAAQGLARRSGAFQSQHGQSAASAASTARHGAVLLGVGHAAQANGTAEELDARSGAAAALVLGHSSAASGRRAARDGFLVPGGVLAGFSGGSGAAGSFGVAAGHSAAFAGSEGGLPAVPSRNWRARVVETKSLLGRPGAERGRGSIRVVRDWRGRMERE